MDGDPGSDGLEVRPVELTLGQSINPDRVLEAGLRRPDVLVIGAGVIGVSCAYFLAERGARVTLVDQGEVCAGCSYGNAGTIAPSHSVPLAAPGVIGQGLRWLLDPESPFYIKPRLSLELARWLWRFRAAANREQARRAVPIIRELSLKSIELYERFHREGDWDFSYEERGLLALFLTEAAFGRAVEQSEMLAGFGLESRVIDRTALGDHLNGMETPALGGIHHSTDAHLVPSDFVHGLAHRAQALGAEVLTSTRVRGFDIGDGRVRGVETDNGAIRADEVVLAAGSWSPSLIKGLNVRLPIQPAKGYSVTYTEATRQPPTPTLLAESRVFLTPMRGALRLAGTLELAGMDLSVNPRRVGAIIRAADRYLPELAIANAPHGEVWSGLRPATPDGLPVIGRPPRYSNLTIASGHSMIGFTTGPASGLLTAQMVIGEDPFMDHSPLAPSRFS